jgi:hypothetical protein
MPVVVWLRIAGGDVAETAADIVSDVNADMAEQYRPGSVVDRVGQVDFTTAAKVAGEVAGKGMASLGGAAKVAGPMFIMMVGEWFLDGALQLLAKDANKPAADALAQLGDALLAVMAKILRPMIPLLMRAIRAVVPVLKVIADMVIDVLPYAEVAFTLAAAVLELAASLAIKLWRIIGAIGRRIGSTWAAIQRTLRGYQRTIDGFVSAIVGAAANLLTFVLESVLGPLREHLDNVASLWDEWIGRHLPDVLGEEGLRHPFGYMWNDVWYEWGTGPLGEEPHGRVLEHPASEAQLVAALGTYSRANGGLARALWGPA